MVEIHAVISRFPAECQPSRIDPLGAAGGMSGAQFWRLTAPRGSLLLRRWPDEHPSREQLQFIHAVLQHASRRGADFLPLPLAASDGRTFVEHAGHLWELAPWLSGSADFARSPSDEKLRATLAALAQFHNATADFPDRARSSAPHAVTRHLQRLRALSPVELDKLSNAISMAIWPELAPLARQFLVSLPRAVTRAIAHLEPLGHSSFAMQPCLRDIWHDHVLFDGERVAGIVDFGALEFDTPATDIARLLGSLVGDDSSRWQAGIAAYSAFRPLAQQEKLAALALDASGTILAGCNWIRWLYIEKRQFENPAHICERFRRIAERSAARPFPTHG